MCFFMHMFVDLCRHSVRELSGVHSLESWAFRGFLTHIEDVAIDLGFVEMDSWVFLHIIYLLEVYYMYNVVPLQGNRLVD